LQRIPFRGFGPDRGTSAAEEADGKRWQPGVIPALKKSLSLRDHAVAGRSRASPWMIIEPLPSVQYRRLVLQRFARTESTELING
jgi:hypothetical protein